MKKIILILIIALTAITHINVKASDERFYEGEFIQGIWVNRVAPNRITYYQQFRVQRQQGTNNFAYCLEPFTPIKESEAYTSSTRPENLSEEQLKKVSLIAHFGYNYKNHYDIKWYAITQLMIWKTVMPDGDFYFTDRLNGNRINIYQDEINEINNLINNYEIIPSFSDKTFNYVVGETITITDYNNILNNYSINNNIAKIDNNKLIIDSSKKGAYNFILERKDTYYNKPIIFYNSPNSQNLMETGDLNPLTVKVNVNIDETNIIIKKLDYDNKTTESSGDANLQGAIYEIFNANKELVQEIKIDENSTAEISNLTYQKYYIKEKKAGTGYELDNNIYEFELSKENPSIELNLTNKVIKAKVIINKVYQNETGSYNEPNASFEIYNKDGKLIKTIITDENGEIEIELPYGEYTIKQTTTITGYEIIEPFKIIIDSNKEQVFKLTDYKIKVPNTGTNEINIIDLIRGILVILWTRSLQ